MSAPNRMRRFRVVAIEWLSHRAEIEATSPEAAEAQARELFTNNAEHEVFAFEDSGLDGFVIEEVLP
jgi:hypothetical protein